MNYRVGSIIRYNTIADRVRTIVVIKRSKNVKNGRPGFDGRETGGERSLVWGYDADIIAVVKR